jgi:hypothetical protein
VLTLARSVLGIVVAVLVGGSLPAEGSTPTQLLPSACEVLTGLTPDIWQGAGVVPGADDRWENDANWSLGVAPIHLSDPYACIPAGGLPVIGAAQDAELVALDVAPGATLTLGTGSRLNLSGGALAPSVIAGQVEVDGGTLSGPARVELSGTLLLHTDDPADQATLTTRQCAYLPAPYPVGEQPCLPGVPLVGTPGRLVVGDGGVVDVSGGLVNLGDQYQLSVHGLLRVHDGGSIAADHGTRLELLAPTLLSPGTGTLRFEDDGSYLEGKNDVGLADLGTVVNQGRIIKTGGTGTSVVTGTYSQPSPGAVTVGSGDLLLPSGSAVPASVSAGSAYGTGRCPVPREVGCRAETFAMDPQNVTLRVPTADASGASVVVQELTGASSPDDIGLPVEAHATGLSATPSDPAVLSFRYDASLLGGRGWTSVDIYREATGTTSYVRLQPCLADGSQPSGQEACVDRRGLSSSSRDVFDNGPGNAPDVIMVIRTLDTSRWVAR